MNHKVYIRKSLIYSYMNLFSPDGLRLPCQSPVKIFNNNIIFTCFLIIKSAGCYGYVFHLAYSLYFPCSCHQPSFKKLLPVFTSSFLALFSSILRPPVISIHHGETFYWSYTAFYIPMFLYMSFSSISGS